MLWLITMNSQSPGGRQVVSTQLINISSTASSLDTFMLCDLILVAVILCIVTEQQIEYPGGVAIYQNYLSPATLILDAFQAYFLLFFLNCVVLFFTEYQHIDKW